MFGSLDVATNRGELGCWNDADVTIDVLFGVTPVIGDDASRSARCRRMAVNMSEEVWEVSVELIIIMWCT